MASPSVLQSAAAAAAAAWTRFLPSPRRSAATQPCRVPSVNKFQRKRPLSVAVSHRSRSLCVCRSSDFSAIVATFSITAAVSTAHSDLSMIHFFDSVPDTHVVISGYWIGPDMDDGCGNVVAILQRIA